MVITLNDAGEKNTATIAKMEEVSSPTGEKQAINQEEIKNLGIHSGQHKLTRQQYLDQHPEVLNMWNNFQSSILIDKPENVYEFAQKFFNSTPNTPTQNQYIQPLYLFIYKFTSQQYLDQHPEIHQIWDDFQTSLFIKNPKNVYEFVREYFTSINDVQLTRPLVICGPSGVGKGTLIQKLFDGIPGAFGFSVSHTTRAPRPGEIDGVHYNFVTKEDMKNAIEEGKFIEYAHVHKNIYGTSNDAVKKVQSSGKICILDIDIQGVKKLKEMEAQMKPKPFYIFISPPSIEQLETRLRSRNTESDEQIRTRISVAEAEVNYGRERGNFDKIIVNDILEDAFRELKTVLSEEYKDLVAFDTIAHAF